MPRKPDTGRPPTRAVPRPTRRATDRVGCGEPPSCSPKTLKNLLEAGLLVDQGGEVLRDALGSCTVPSYAMPVQIHSQWCSAVAFTDAEMAEFEAELGAAR